MTWAYTFVFVTKGNALLTGELTVVASNGVLTITWTVYCADGVLFTPVFCSGVWQGEYGLVLSYDAANTAFWMRAHDVL